MKRFFVLAFVFLIISGLVYAKTKYVKPAELMSTMQGFTKALGQDCSFCHISNKAVSIKNTDKYSMKKDFEKMQNQQVAKAMIGQLQMFNNFHKTKTECMSCHQGKSNL